MGVKEETSRLTSTFPCPVDYGGYGEYSDQIYPPATRRSDCGGQASDGRSPPRDAQAQGEQHLPHLAPARETLELPDRPPPGVSAIGKPEMVFISPPPAVCD